MSVFILQSSAQGTVPYLGIFLTDLTMLDAAVKDRLEVRHTGRRTHQIWKYSYNIHSVFFSLRMAISTSTNGDEWVLFLFTISLLNMFWERISCAEMDYFLSGPWRNLRFWLKSGSYSRPAETAPSERTSRLCTGTTVSPRLPKRKGEC